MSIVPERPMSGRNVKVTVTAPGASSISLAVAGGGCGTLYGRDRRDERLLLTGTAADDGYCDLSATATYSGRSHEGPCRKLRGPGDRSRPAAGHAGRRGVRAPAVPAGLDIGQPTDHHRHRRAAGVRQWRFGYLHGPPRGSRADCGGPGPRARVRGSLPGPGHVDRRHGERQPAFCLGLLRDRPGGNPAEAAAAALHDAAATAGTLNLQFSLQDVLGAVSSAFSLNLNPAQVTTGDVKVSIAWDTPTDVDLHVTEPSGERDLLRATCRPPTGGDWTWTQTPGCTIDNVNNENITGPRASPPTATSRSWSTCTNPGAAALRGRPARVAR